MSLNDSLPRYHAVGLGVDRIQIYDQDGTAEPFVREFVASGLVTYLPSWAQATYPGVFGKLAKGSRRAAGRAERSC